MFDFILSCSVLVSVHELEITVGTFQHTLCRVCRN